MALTQVDQGLLGTYAQYTGFKNRILNGQMVIDQRNAGASTTPTTTGSGVYALDRWVTYASQSSKFSIQQNAGSVTPPVGFVNYLGITSLSAYSVGATDYFIVSQRIEGLNTADLAWGTANASSVTLSFKVYSSLTGTFGGVITNSAQNRTYPFTYTVSSANTWTSISITIAGDTTGTWLTTNGTGLWIIFGLGCGSSQSASAGAWGATSALSATGATSVVGTNGATFYLTGVQLEKGSTATSFDYRPYGTELQLCQRYYWKNKPDTLYSWLAVGRTESTFMSLLITYPQEMRAYPTLSYSNLAASVGTLGSSLALYAGKLSALYQVNVTSGGTVGYANALQQNSGGVGYLDATAEL